MLYLLAQETPPENLGVLDVLLLPVGLTFLGFVIFYAGWFVENRLTKAPWKWIAVAPVAYAIVVGFDTMQKYRDPFYSSLIDSAGGGRKMVFAHYGSFVIPILG